MTSTCIPSLVLSRTCPPTTPPSDGIAYRIGTTQRRSMPATKNKPLRAQLDDWKWSTTQRNIIVATKDKRLRAQLDDWKRNRILRSSKVATKEEKLRAQLDDWKTSGSSSDTLNAQLARDDLLGLIAGEERGLRTQRNSRKRDEIIKAIDALTVLGVGSVTTDKSLSEAWRMLWTTEKEQLFIVEKAHLFGTEAGDILQVIDVASRTLNNVITFPPTGMFLVNSTIDVESAQRVNFKFTSASLRIDGWKFPFPPFGQGWFESVYLDDKIRVSKDIRGDYLVVDRAPSVPDLA